VITQAGLCLTTVPKRLILDSHGYGQKTSGRFCLQSPRQVFLGIGHDYNLRPVARRAVDEGRLLIHLKHTVWQIHLSPIRWLISTMMQELAESPHQPRPQSASSDQSLRHLRSLTRYGAHQTAAWDDQSTRAYGEETDRFLRLFAMGSR